MTATCHPGVDYQSAAVDRPFDHVPPSQPFQPLRPVSRHLWDADQTTYTTGVDQIPGQGTDFTNHKGPFNSESDTDNRIPFKVAILIERYE